MLNLSASRSKNREPWLEWTGKRERKGFEVDPVALHIHERVAAKAIMAVAARQEVQRSLFGDPHSRLTTRLSSSTATMSTGPTASSSATPSRSCPPLPNAKLWQGRSK